MRLRSDIKQIRIKHVINRVGSNKLTCLEKCYIKLSLSNYLVCICHPFPLICLMASFANWLAANKCFLNFGIIPKSNIG